MSHAEGVKPVDCAHVLMEIPVMLVVTWAELQKEKIAIIKIVQVTHKKILFFDKSCR